MLYIVFMKRLLTLTVLLTILILNSCKTGTSPTVPDMDDGSLSKKQQRLIEAAYWAEGRKELKVNGRKYNMDCSGLMLAVYARAGIDLEETYRHYEGNGVLRIYRYMKDKELFYKTNMPSPGDLIFWNDTYDKNNDGKVNDTLTHTGMVVSVDKKGNILFIHENYRLGIVFAKMNMKKKNNPDYNAPMRMKSLGPTPDGRYLSSQLINGFARAYEM